MLKRILVLADDPNVIALIERDLVIASKKPDSSHEFVLESFTLPSNALERANKQHFDAVIAEHIMSGTDGFSFLKAMAEIQPDCVRLVLGGQDDMDMLVNLVNHTDNFRVIQKPWKRAELTRLLTEVLGTLEESKQVAPQATLTTLRATPLLSELPEAELTELTAVAHWISVKLGKMVVRQNEQSTSVLFILSGFVKIMRGSSAPVELGETGDRRQKMRSPLMVALLGPGDMMGELAAFLGERRTASIVTLTACQLIEIPSRYFLGCLTRNPPFSLAVMRKMAQRLIDADRQIELTRGNVEGRIHALIRHCEKQGIDTSRWLTNAEIARMVGASRVAVSQIVGRIQKKSESQNIESGEK